MDNRKLIIIGCIVAGVVVILAVVAVRNRSDTNKPSPRLPEVVGQPVPAAVFEIDFDKRYDLHCSPVGTQSEVVLRRCKIIGSTGPGHHPSVPSPYAELYAQALSSGRWLVLELPDGRRAYAPPESIRLIEESPEDK
jgi:hypothetical protein